MGTTNVYCIIVTYNGMKWLERCLGSLRNSTHPLKVIAIDNSSTDETVDYITSNFPEVILIKSTVNLGFGKANNIGLKKAVEENANYVFLLNQDAWIKPDTISTLVQVQQLHKEYGLISPMHLNGDGSKLEFKFVEYIQPNECPEMVSDKFLGAQKQIYETTFVNAAAWLIPKDVLEKVGGFDPLFSHYGEDVDYVQRVRFNGIKVGICPGTFIYHDSRIQHWNEIMWNKPRMLTIYLSEVKNVNGRLRSNMLIFLKRNVDGLTSNLLFRQFKLFVFRFKLVCKIISMIPSIRKARKKSLTPNAFL